MKNFSFILPIFFLQFLLVIQLHAQREYWGVTTKGGSSFVFTNQNGVVNAGLGVIFKTDKNGQNQQVLHNFDSATGFEYQHSLTEAIDGKLYGLTSQITNGIPGSCGVLYKIDPITKQYSIIKVLAAGLNSGLYTGPGGRLLSATNGKLYGIRPDFVNFQDIKILYSYDPITGIFSDLYTFTYVGGSNVQFINQGSNGRLYIFFEYGGGIGRSGAIFEYNINSNTAVMVHDFINNNGSQPYGGIHEWLPNIFYGTFANGDNAALAKGGIYRFDATTRAYSIVARMDSIGGDGPFCSLSRVGNKLYGATGYGSGSPANPYGPGGIIFEFEPATNTLKKLYELCPFINCQGYLDPLLPGYVYNNETGRGVELVASNGLLYGLTRFSMFSFNTVTNQFTNLFGLTSYKGREPIGRLIEICTKPYTKNVLVDTTIFAPLGSPFSVKISTTNTDSFLWRKNGIFINDTDSILNFNPFTIADTGRYTCQLSNECGNTITKMINLKAIVTPVTLTAFIATLQNNNTVLLQWQTSMEVNNKQFIIQRSSDGISFENIGLVNGNGTTNLPHYYNFTDRQLPAGNIYYRLQQQDVDGNYTYSRVVLVKNILPQITISPNPAKSYFVISVPLSLLTVAIHIYDSKGSLVLQQQGRAGSNIVDCKNWQAGEYIIRINDANGHSATKKIIINKN